MATLITCRDISKAYGTHVLFDRLSIAFSDRERAGLIGPNGAGKSTLLKVLTGMEHLDAGECIARRDARIVYLAQDDVFTPGATVAGALDAVLHNRFPEPHERETQIQIALGRFDFRDGDRLVSTLSGGWQKRLSIVRAFIQDPELLLLDEPTNHLDLDGILWLEDLLDKVTFGFVLVTHDRYFLENVTERVIDLNPAYAEGYYSVDGSYSVFIEKREQLLAGQRTQQKSLAGKVRQEIEWLRTGPKARRTKAKYRITSADQMIAAHDDLRRRNRLDIAAGIDFGGTGRKTRKLLVAEGLKKQLGGKPLFEDVDLWLTPGSRVGLLGQNGSGKSTLIRILTGELAPDAGSIRRAEGLETVVFDQQRDQLPQDAPLSKALCGQGTHVLFRGQSIHVASWAQRFLFRVEQLDMPVGELSGGEQARILVARLMLRPADVLILDEPTNDLDIPSLDVLEESLVRFPGAVILVTHDRYLLDRICDEIIALDGAGNARTYAAYLQWQFAQERAQRITSDANTAPPKHKAKPAVAKAVDKSKPFKLTYRERQELEGMEERILEAEARVDELRLTVEDPQVATDHVELAKRCEALHEAEERVAELYAQWEALESRS